MIFLKKLPINSINIDIKADLSDSLNNIVKNTLEKPSKSTGDIAETLISFVHNCFLYPLQKYNIYAKSKLKKFELELKNKIVEINPKEMVESSVNIVGPTIEGLKYNLDEEYIKNMFINILISDMTENLKNKVQPCYIEIVKQLSSSDAKLINMLKDNKADSLSLMIIKDFNSENKGYHIIDYVIAISQNNYIIPKTITLDNLQRLGLVRIHEKKAILGEEEMCKLVFKNIKSNYSHKENSTIIYENAILEITELGQNFIIVCTR